MATATLAKHPWEMRRGEYIDAEHARMKGQSGYQKYSNTLKRHRIIIDKALKEGKAVPAEVLKDYPELGKKEEPKVEAGVKPLPQEGSIIVRGKMIPIAYEINGKKYKASAVLAPTRGKSMELHNDIFFGPYKVGTGDEITKAHIDKGIALAKAQAKPEAPAKPEPKGKKEGKASEFTEKATKKIEQAIRNIGRRKYQRLAQADYANTGIELFNENQLAYDLDVSPSDLEEVIPIRRHESMFGGKPIMWAATEKELRGSIPKLAHHFAKREEYFAARKEAAKKAGLEYPKEKPKPKPRKEIAVLQTKPTKQSDRALAIDRSLLAKQVVLVDDPRWLKHPNRFDVRGIDTPGKGRIIRGVAYADRGARRLSRRHHRGFKRVRFT